MCVSVGREVCRVPREYRLFEEGSGPPGLADRGSRGRRGRAV